MLTLYNKYVPTRLANILPKTTVPALFQSFLTLLATSFGTELAGQVEYLKAETCVLRSKLPARPKVSAAERAELVKLGQPVGKALKDLIGIVSPRTFARWVNGESAAKPSPPDWLEAIPVSTFVNNVRNNSPKCVEPLASGAGS